MFNKEMGLAKKNICLSKEMTFIILNFTGFTILSYLELLNLNEWSL